MKRLTTLDALFSLLRSSLLKTGREFHVYSKALVVLVGFINCRAYIFGICASK